MNQSADHSVIHLLLQRSWPIRHSCMRVRASIGQAATAASTASSVLRERCTYEHVMNVVSSSSAGTNRSHSAPSNRSLSSCMRCDPLARLQKRYVNARNEWLIVWMNELRKEWLNKWLNEWMNGRVHDWFSEWMNEWANKCMIGLLSDWMSQSMHARLNEWMTKWLNDWMRAWMSQWVC